MKKILIIDDSELVRQLLKEALNVAGYEVRIAVDAGEGYSSAIDFRPDLILLDVQLPDVTGFELCRVIKNRDELRDIPIIMITGTAHRTEEKVKGFQLGADDYVMKPFEVPELLGRIQAILRRSEGTTASPAPAAPAIPLPAPIPETAPRTLEETVGLLLTRPEEFPEGSVYPAIGKIFLLVSITLTVLGLAASSGGNLRWIPAALSVAALWLLSVSVLVIASSIIGVSLTWTEGAALISLAGLPLLIRLAGGCFLALVTTLSPFYITASPALFTKSGGVWLRRVDLFEFWSVFLLYVLLSRRPHVAGRKAKILTVLLWGVGIGMAVVFERWGVGL